MTLDLHGGPHDGLELELTDETFDAFAAEPIIYLPDTTTGGRWWTTYEPRDTDCWFSGYVPRGAVPYEKRRGQ